MILHKIGNNMLGKAEYTGLICKTAIIYNNKHKIPQMNSYSVVAPLPKTRKTLQPRN